MYPRSKIGLQSPFRSIRIQHAHLCPRARSSVKCASLEHVFSFQRRRLLAVLTSQQCMAWIGPPTDNDSHVFVLLLQSEQCCYFMLLNLSDTSANFVQINLHIISVLQ